jgi:hypothetical protein
MSLEIEKKFKEMMFHLEINEKYPLGRGLSPVVNIRVQDIKPHPKAKYPDTNIQ